MRNNLIFGLLLVGVAGTMALAVTDRTRTATVDDIFAEQIEGVDYRWVYLRDTSSEQTLDSCRLPDHRFTLAAEVPAPFSTTPQQAPPAPVCPALHTGPKQI